MIGAIFARGLITPQPNLIASPPNWMTPELLEHYKKLFALQEKSGMSLVTLGIRFMIAQKEMDTIIIGAKTPSEIEECVRASEQGPLPEELTQHIETLGVE